MIDKTILEDVRLKEQKTMDTLKDFQRATVERIDSLFREKQNRVLVADEVGLGKTLIARGVISKMAKLRFEEEKDDLFKVVYICANLSVASQNLLKLNIFNVKIGDVGENRLSMQHLLTAEQELESKQGEYPIQLIAMTPATSFQMTAGGGDARERAVMFAILRRLPELAEYEKMLDELLMDTAKKGWAYWANIMEERVARVESNPRTAYPKSVLRDIRKNYKETIKELVSYLDRMESGEEQPYKAWKILAKLRKMFAEISVNELNPDLVIMDEFQRFKSLIQDDDTETSMLANKFFSNKDIRVLLLSATPYKLYSTLEEIDENSVDEHYEEFFNVINFLFDNDERIGDFKKVWNNYSVALHELKEGDSAILALKEAAENELYQGICRTERISVMDNGDYTDDSAVKEHIKISEKDIQSYLQFGKVLEDMQAGFSLPVDYVKSCPYLMSFMKNYKVKEKIEKYYKKHPYQVNKVNQELLWIKKSLVKDYKPLPASNARLEELKKQVFCDGAELLLWVPPARPYYELGGVYKGKENFSKFLVFSSWEMVPRMIGSLISYESERLTVGKLVRQARNDEKKNTTYFADGKKRFPAPRLRFNVSSDQPQGMSLFALLYPSKTLAEMYNPVSCINKHMSLSDIEEALRDALTEKISRIEEGFGGGAEGGREDNKWYYLAPMLMDGIEESKDWMRSMRRDDSEIDDNTDERGKKGFYAHLDKLEKFVTAMPYKGKLGRKPTDLVDVLINMIIGSPAICIYRANGGDKVRAFQLAKVFINRFNSGEGTAVVDLAYGRKKDDSVHWKNVLRYCKDGNFQAMFDEYTHVIKENAGFAKDEEELQKVVHENMMDALQIHTASYSVDTFNDFKSRLQGVDKSRTSIRSQFAVGFSKSDGGESKNVERKDSIRNAFNSPLRPFVLATTSIGQEGLDFHNYCRKIVHWNLPSNPIDLEQREGRINRFKCLAIRQNIAQKYGNIHFNDDEPDIWRDMFDRADKHEKSKGQSDLVPFWCLGKNQDIKIERIVPMYPISKDELNYERLIKILSLYRLTLGQARQEELMEYMFNEFEDTEKLKKLFINLSPYSKK